jgi:hypothetical protein
MAKEHDINPSKPLQTLQENNIFLCSFVYTVQDCLKVATLLSLKFVLKISSNLVTNFRYS